MQRLLAVPGAAILHHRLPLCRQLIECALRTRPSDGMLEPRQEVLSMTLGGMSPGHTSGNTWRTVSHHVRRSVVPAFAKGRSFREPLAMTSSASVAAERNAASATSSSNTVSTTNIGPLQTLDWDLQPQQFVLPDPTKMFKRPNVLRCYGTRIQTLHGNEAS